MAYIIRTYTVIERVPETRKRIAREYVLREHHPLCECYYPPKMTTKELIDFTLSIPRLYADREQKEQPKQ